MSRRFWLSPSRWSASAGQRLGLEQEGGIGGHLDIAQPDFLEELLGAPLPDRHRVHPTQGVAHQGPRRRVVERPALTA